MVDGRLGTYGHPVAGEHRERPLLGAWVLVLFATLVPLVPLVPLVGYLVRVVVASERDDGPPALFADPVALVRRGIGGTVVLLAYLALPVVALVVTVYGAMETGTGSTPGFATVLVFYGGSTVVLCLALLGAYLCPIALYAYGRDGRLRGAVDRATLRGVGGHAAYFVRWTGGALALAVTGAVAASALSVPRVGPVLASLGLAYGSILAFHLWGRAIGVARER